jgi:hypothetical protein
VPHLAIVPSILHYTQPGDVVLDGFAGSGMTGVAAQWCGTCAGQRTGHELELGVEEGRPRSRLSWGARRAVLNDLVARRHFHRRRTTTSRLTWTPSPRRASNCSRTWSMQIGWMYETTLHSDGKHQGPHRLTT